MSSKSRPVDYGGIVWKVVPGSRREQLLLRFIEQDRMLKGAGFVRPGQVIPVEPASEWQEVIGIWAGAALGATVVGFLWWLL